MSARILVVDDIDINLRLMEARLSAEYYQVLTARSGEEALAICAREPVDLVLLDVMMPGMDGFETCRRLKADPATAHLPVVLVTALDQPADRVKGLEAGADDFLTKPARDLQLFSRVRSLTRLKLLTDELRGRAQTALSMVARADLLGRLSADGRGGDILVFDGDASSAERLSRILSSEHSVRRDGDPEAFLAASKQGSWDLLVISLAVGKCDPLRLCSQIRSCEATRMLPILLVAEIGDDVRTARALELGANDYLARPLDRNELLARARTQVKRKRYDESLRQSLRETMELAVKDGLTGLYNRRFFDSHLAAALDRARTESKPFSVVLADIDHFKQINDNWGHDAGDAVLREFAVRLGESIRASDLACRYGGEEFALLMPEADHIAASATAERLRMRVQEQAFQIGASMIPVTVSVGYAVLDPGSDDASGLLKRADRSLYEAKRSGRNRVVSLAA